MTEREILNQIKQTHPIIEGERTTWLNPTSVAETFNIPMEMANKVAMEYNSEILLNQIKQTHPIIEGERTTWLNPTSLVETFNIPMEMASKVANKYNAQIASISQGISR